MKLLINRVLRFVFIIAVFTLICPARTLAASGNALWAKSTAAGAPSDSYFGDSVIDSNGNVYVIGFLRLNGTFDFGNGVTVTGGTANGVSVNALLVKYNSSGIAQWARSTAVGAPEASYFNDITIDSNNNIYIAGALDSAGTFDFGNGVTVAGGNGVMSSLLIKYNSSGFAQWAKSTVSGDVGVSTFGGIDIDSNGYIYCGISSLC